MERSPGTERRRVGWMESYLGKVGRAAGGREGRKEEGVRWMASEERK